MVQDAPEDQPPQRENPNTQKVDPTQAYINTYMNMHGGDVKKAWLQAMSDRLEKPNDVPLRNAEHALYSQHFINTHGVTGKAAMAVATPLYTGLKQATQPASADPAPMDEMKWGFKPIAGNVY